MRYLRELFTVSLVDRPLFFWLCMVLAVLLRVYLSFATTFWLDELWSSGFSHPSHSLSAVIQLTLADVHPPLYQILLHYWFIAFGFTELSARMLSLLIGLLCIPAFVLLAGRIYEMAEARVASLLFIMNLTAICFAAEVRSYELLLLLSIVASYAMASFIRTQQKRFGLLYLVVSIALIYTHYFGLVLLLSHGVVWLLMLYRQPRQRVLWYLGGIFIVLLLAFMPLLPAVLNNVGRAGFWIKNPGLGEWLSYSLILFGGPFALPLLALLVAILIKNTATWTFRECALLLAVLLVLEVPYLAGFFVNPMLTARNAIIAVPYLCLLLAYPVSKAILPLRAAFLGVSLLLVLLGFVLVPKYKGEDLDVLLVQVQQSQLPLLIVNDKALATDGFVQTKIDLQPEKYATIPLGVWPGDMDKPLNAFWLACYHSCFRLHLESYIPEGYQQIKQVKARGVDGRLLQRTPH